MLHFWLSVLIKGFWDSVEFVGQTRTGIFFGTLILVITVLWLWKKHGWKDAWTHLWRTAGEGLITTCVAWTLVFGVHLIYEPFHLLNDMSVRREKSQEYAADVLRQSAECSSDLKTSLATSKLQQSQLTSQQVEINSGQSNMNLAQTTMNKCVLSLIERSKQEPQKTTLVMQYAQPDPQPGKRHVTMLFLTNKSVSPLTIIVGCEGEIKKFKGDILTQEGNTIQMGETVMLDKHSARVSISSPAWTPITPLAVHVWFDDNLGRCGFKPLS
jgi:hypothetical protein